MNVYYYVYFIGTLDADALYFFLACIVYTNNYTSTHFKIRPSVLRRTSEPRVFNLKRFIWLFL